MIQNIEKMFRNIDMKIKIHKIRGSNGKAFILLSTNHLSEIKNYYYFTSSIFFFL